MRSHTSITCALTLALLAIAGSAVDCAQSATKEAECRLNSDCPGTQSCERGRCVVECRLDRDCTRLGDQCVQGRCMSREPSQRLCTRFGDCRSGETCQAGVCAPQTFTHEDAATGSPPDAGPVRPTDAEPLPPRDAAAPPDAAPPPDAASPPDSGPLALPDAAPMARLPYGAVCARGSDCASDLCLGPTGAPAGRCTRTCSANTDCVYPDHCLDIAGAGRLCATNPSTRATGEPCPNGPNDCGTGLCVSLDTGGQICTQQCSPIPACPPGLACAPVADGRGGSVPVCTPGTGRGFGEACSTAAQCASTLCVGLPQSTAGMCTALCGRVPCPPGHTCNAVSDGSGGMVAVCLPL